MSTSKIARHTPKFRQASNYSAEEHRAIIAAILADTEFCQLLKPNVLTLLGSKSRNERIDGLLLVYRLEDLLEYALAGRLLKPNPEVEAFAHKRAVTDADPAPAKLPSSPGPDPQQSAENRRRADAILAQPEMVQRLSGSLAYKLRSPIPAEVARGLARYDEFVHLLAPQEPEEPTVLFAETPEFLPLFERSYGLTEALADLLEESSHRMSGETQRRIKRELENFNLIQSKNESWIQAYIGRMEKLLETPLRTDSVKDSAQPPTGEGMKNVLSGADARAVMANRPNPQGAAIGRGDAISGTSGKSKRHRQASANKRKKKSGV